MKENGSNTVILSGSRESGRSRRIPWSRLHGFATGFESRSLGGQNGTPYIAPGARGSALRLDRARDDK